MALVVFDGSLNPASQLVFDSDGSVAVLEGTGSGGSLLFDADPENDVHEADPDFDVLVLDGEPAGVVAGEVPRPPHYVDQDLDRDSVVVDREGKDLVVISDDGPPGKQGEQGDPGQKGDRGDPGPPGAGAYYQPFYFASPLHTWRIEHGLGTYGVRVETVDLQGESLEGNVRYLDENVIEVDWYYPTAGEARLDR